MAASSLLSVPVQLWPLRLCPQSIGPQRSLSRSSIDPNVSVAKTPARCTRSRVVIIRHCRVMIRECVRPLLSSPPPGETCLSPGSSASRTLRARRSLSPRSHAAAVTTRRGKTSEDEFVRTNESATSRRRERIQLSRSIVHYEKQKYTDRQYTAIPTIDLTIYLLSPVHPSLSLSLSLSLSFSRPGGKNDARTSLDETNEQERTTSSVGVER